MANSIWTEDPKLRCQYSPHYLCSLLIQGGGGGGRRKTKCHEGKKNGGTTKHGQIIDSRTDRDDQPDQIPGRTHDTFFSGCTFFAVPFF